MARSSLEISAPPGGLRHVALLVHRYVGLLMAVFLLVAGVTGTVLVFYEELDAAVSPELLRTPTPPPGAEPLDPFVLHEKVRGQLPEGQELESLILDVEPGKASSTWIEVEEGTWRQFFVDPFTGAVLGSRSWGDLSEGSKNLMPFLYRLHYSLALGDVGIVLFGVVALLWTIDCFVGAYLTLPGRTLPSRQGERAGRSPAAWLRRWVPAWLVRTNKLFSFVFTWHRASGLWVWALLLVFAWSGVGLNLQSVYQPVMGALFGMKEGVHEGLPELPEPYPEPGLTLREAYAQGRRLMALEADRRGFDVKRELRLLHAADHGVFVYSVESSLDISTKYPRTELYFDDQDGHLVGFEAATGISAGNTLSSWLINLHLAAVGGLWYRILVSVLGLGVAALTVTGVWIWWRKRAQRRRKRVVQGRSSAPVPVVPALARLVRSPLRLSARDRSC